MVCGLISALVNETRGVCILNRNLIEKESSTLQQPHTAPWYVTLRAVLVSVWLVEVVVVVEGDITVMIIKKKLSFFFSH